MNRLYWILGIITGVFWASTKTVTTAAKTTIKMHACKKGLLTLHYEADRDGNAVRDIDWKIKFPGTDVWMKFFTCTYKPGLVCCKKHQTVLADGFTLLNNSNCDYSHYRTVTIERSRNATHHYAEIMYQVHYFDHSVSPSRREYQVKFTAQCVRMQEGRDINLTEILLLNSLPCERVIDIEWYSINGSRFAHCNSCQLCTITSDRNHPVPGFWNRLQVTSGSLLLTGIQYNDNGLKLRVTAHLKIASDSDKPLVFRIWIFVDSGRDSSASNTATTRLALPTSKATAVAPSTSRADTGTASSGLHSPESSYPGDVVSTPSTSAKLHSVSHSLASTTRGQPWIAVVIAEIVLCFMYLR